MDKILIMLILSLCLMGLINTCKSDEGFVKQEETFIRGKDYLLIVGIKEISIHKYSKYYERTSGYIKYKNVEYQSFEPDNQHYDHTKPKGERISERYVIVISYILENNDYVNIAETVHYNINSNISFDEFIDNEIEILKDEKIALPAYTTNNHTYYSIPNKDWKIFNKDKLNSVNYEN